MARRCTRRSPTGRFLLAMRENIAPKAAVP
jgi:hypothetical protein